VIDLETANRAFAGSVACRMFTAAIDQWSTASRESAVLRQLRTMAVTMVPAEAAARLRWWAMTLGWAFLAHLVIREALPRYAVSGLPWWWQLTGAGCAFVVAVAADPIAAWWQHAAVARLWRDLTN